MRAIVKRARVGTQGPAKSANKVGPSVLMISHKSRLMTTPSFSRSPLIHALPSLCVPSMCARMCAWRPLFLLQADYQWVTGLPQEPSQGPGEYPPWSIPANLPSWERGLSPHRSRPPSMPCTRRSPPHQTLAATPRHHNKHGKVRRTGGLFSSLRVPRQSLLGAAHVVRVTTSDS